MNSKDRQRRSLWCLLMGPDLVRQVKANKLSKTLFFLFFFKKRKQKKTSPLSLIVTCYNKKTGISILGMLNKYVGLRSQALFKAVGRCIFVLLPRECRGAAEG